MSDEKLSPCGFCGSNSTGVTGDNEYHWAVCCDCLAETGMYKLKSEAVTAWNRVMDKNKLFQSGYCDEWTGKLILTTAIPARYGGFRTVRFTAAANNLADAQYILKEMGLENLPLEIAK